MSESNEKSLADLINTRADEVSEAVAEDMLDRCGLDHVLSMLSDDDLQLQSVARNAALLCFQLAFRKGMSFAIDATNIIRKG